MAIAAVLESLAILPLSVELGEVHLPDELSEEKLHQFRKEISLLGFELLDDGRAKLIEKTKNTIIKLVHNENANLKSNLSEYLSEKLACDYHSLSHLFSELEGTTIEKYFILHRIEKVKELIVYNEFSIKEIAFLLNYSSLSHLSTQFKSVTGFSPRHFKEVLGNERKSLDAL